MAHHEDSSSDGPNKLKEEEYLKVSLLEEGREPVVTLTLSTVKLQHSSHLGQEERSHTHHLSGSQVRYTWGLQWASGEM